MREVHRSQLELSVEWMEEQGVSREAIYARAGVSPSGRERDGEYVSWECFARSLNVFELWFPHDAMLDGLAKKFLKLPQNQVMPTLMRNLSDPATMYALGNRIFGPRHFPCIRGTEELVGPRLMRVDLHIDARAEVVCPLYAKVTCRIMEQFPSLLMGLPEASAAVIEVTARHITIQIELPESRSLLHRVKSNMGQMLSGMRESSAIEEAPRRELKGGLAERLAQLEQKERELEEKRRELVTLARELRAPLIALLDVRGPERARGELERVVAAGEPLLHSLDQVLQANGDEGGPLTADEGE